MNNMLIKILLIFSSYCWAQSWEGNPVMMGPDSQFLANYRGAYRFASPQSHDGKDWALNEQSFMANAKVYQGEKNQWRVMERSHWFNPDSESRKIPNFYDHKVGIIGSHTLNNEDKISENLLIGSASDKPFASWNVMTYSLTGMYTNKKSETSSWVYAVNMSNGRNFMNNIPLPGVSYVYTPNKSSVYIIGVPFFMMRAPLTDTVSLNISSFIPWYLKSQLSWRFFGPFSLSAGYQFSQIVFMRKDRNNASDRYFYDEMKATVGLFAPLTRLLVMELEGAWNFRRRVFEAESYGGPKHDLIDIDPAPSIAWSLSMRI